MSLTPRQHDSFQTDHRGVSTAVTHVLAIGITTILISALLIAAAGLLTGQQDNAARTELQEIGNRIGEQMYAASTNVDAGTSDSVTVRLDQPPRVSGYSYTVANVSVSECENDPLAAPPNGPPDACLRLDVGPGLNIRAVFVPVDLDESVTSYDSLTVENTGGGEIVITLEG